MNCLPVKLNNQNPKVNSLIKLNLNAPTHVETAVKCRICRQESRKDVVALHSKAPFGRLSYAQIYEYVTNYENLQSGPQFLCRICTVDLSVAYDFKKKCVKSEQLYERNSTMTTTTMIKKEKPESEEEDEKEPEVKLVKEPSPPRSPEPQNIVCVPEYVDSLKMEDSFSENMSAEGDDSMMKDEEDFSSDYDEPKPVENPSKRARVRPVKTEDSDESFECPFCHEIFPTIHTIIEHIHYDHNGRKMKCDLPGCAFQCELPFQLHRHKSKVHTEKAVKGAPCEFCNEFTGLGKELVKHSLEKHMDKETKCPKEGCEFKYFFSYQLETHNRMSHRALTRKIGTKYKCTKCDIILQTRTRMYKHREEVHNIPRPKKQIAPSHLKETTLCPHCGKSMKVSSLTIHIQLVHEKLKSGFFICDICGNNYSTKISITNHIKYAHMERPIIRCRHCPETFPSVAARRYHEIRTHTHDYKHICNICGMKCYGQTNLKNHMATHTGAKDYHCNVCDAKFNRSTLLKDHMMVHTDERSCICQICGSGFKMPKYLKSHMKTHTKRGHVLE